MILTYLSLYISAENIAITILSEYLNGRNHRLQDNIKIDLKQIGCGCADYISLVQDV